MVDLTRSPFERTAFGRQGSEVRTLSPRPFSLAVTGSASSTVFFIVHFVLHVDDEKDSGLPEPVTTSENGRGEPIRTSGPCLSKAVTYQKNL